MTEAELEVLLSELWSLESNKLLLVKTMPRLELNVIQVRDASHLANSLGLYVFIWTGDNRDSPLVKLNKKLATSIFKVYGAIHTQKTYLPTYCYCLGSELTHQPPDVIKQTEAINRTATLLRKYGLSSY